MDQRILLLLCFVLYCIVLFCFVLFYFVLVLFSNFVFGFTFKIEICVTMYILLHLLYYIFHTSIAMYICTLASDFPSIQSYVNTYRDVLVLLQQSSVSPDRKGVFHISPHDDVSNTKYHVL